MGRTRHTGVTVLLAALLLTAAGCGTYEEKRQAARDRWEKATAQAKVPVARDYFEADRVEEALKTVNECLSVDPENPQANLLMGEIMVHMGKNTEAQQYFLVAVTFDETLDAAWAYLGAIAQENDKPERAQEYYGRALELKPLSLDYILSLSEVYALQGMYEEASDLLAEKTRRMPQESRLRIAAANLKHRQGDVEGATRLYQETLLVDADNVEALEALGYCHIAQERWAEAVDTFERLVSLSEGPRKSVYLQMLSVCSMNGGQYGKAVSYFDKLSVDKRDDPQVWLNMGQAALGASSPERALACAKRALSLRPGWNEAVVLKGCAQYLSRDYRASISTFKPLTADPKFGGFAWLMTGRCYQQLGQVALSERAYETAARMNPDSKLAGLLTQGEH